MTAYRDKQRKHQQTQELYDRLKRREMTAATQSAAFESVDDVIGNPYPRPDYHAPIDTRHYPAARGVQAQRDYQPTHVDRNGIEQVHSHQRSGSNNGSGSGGLMPPPPVIRHPGVAGSALNHGESHPS